MHRWLSDPPPAHVFEITEYALSGVSPRNPAQLNRERLPERGLTPSPSLPNLIKPQLYRDAIARVSEANAARATATALVIPDYSARMAILDFEEFPSNDSERLSLLRFRLKKSVPFHIDEAQIAYSIQRSQPGRVEVLAVTIARPILTEYESLFVEAGLRVGLVVPSLLASLAFCEQSHEGITLLVKLTQTTLSMGLIEKGQLRLVRCLDLTSEELDVSDSSIKTVFPILQQTLAFAEDQLDKPVNRALLCGFGLETNSLGDQIEQEFGIPFAPVKSRFGPALPENAGMLGLLEQYAA